MGLAIEGHDADKQSHDRPDHQHQHKVRLDRHAAEDQKARQDPQQRPRRHQPERPSGDEIGRIIAQRGQPQMGPARCKNRAQQSPDDEDEQRTGQKGH